MESQSLIPKGNRSALLPVRRRAAHKHGTELFQSLPLP